jgi:hypothetical protein
VRRVRMTEELDVVIIKDRKTGKPYKAYKPDGNAFADLYELPERMPERLSRSGIFFAPFTPQCVCKRKDAFLLILMIDHKLGYLKRYAFHTLCDFY